MSKDLIMVEAQERVLGLEIQRFDLSQRRARLLAQSAFFPKELLTGQDRGVANAVLCYDLAERMNLSVLEVSQNINIIHGRPTFSVKFQLARLYESGIIKGHLKYREDANATECTAYAITADGETLEGITVTIKMATAEGWRKTVGRNGQPISSKYDTMPRLMLRKRAVSFWIGDYAPQILLGMETNNETDNDEAIEVYMTPPTQEIVKEVESVPDYDRETGEVFEIPVEVEESVKAQSKSMSSKYTNSNHTIDGMSEIEKQTLAEFSA